MLHIKLSINQTGNGDPPPKDPIKPHRQPADPVPTDTTPVKPKK